MLEEKLYCEDQTTLPNNFTSTIEIAISEDFNICILILFQL